MRIKLMMGITFVLSLLLANSGQALAEIRQGNDVVITKAEEINDDVYVFAQIATVNGTIKGDLIFFGQKLTINGSVEGDLIAAAQKIIINGKVSDDARIAGQILTLHDSANVGDDLIASGYSLECTQASRIGGEVKYAGYQSAFKGRVDKQTQLASSNCELSGNFGDDVSAVVESNNYGLARLFGGEAPLVPIGLTVTESADIAGQLNYQSAREANISPDSIIAGEVEHTHIDSVVNPPQTLTEQAGNFAKHIFAMLFVGLLVVYFCPNWTGRVTDNVQRRPLASLGYGVISLILMFTGVILLLVTTIAISILLGLVALDNLIPIWLWLGLLTTGLVFVSCWIYSAWVAKIIVSAWIGNRIINGIDWNPSKPFISLALGVLILGAFAWVPAVGAAISLIVILIGIGSTAIWMFTKSPASVSKKEMARNLKPDRVRTTVTATN